MCGPCTRSLLTDLGLLLEQPPRHQRLLQVGAEEAWGAARVVALPLLHRVLQPGHPLKGDGVLQLGEVLLKDQGDDSLGPYGP